jgi:hypothetical protein
MSEEQATYEVDQWGIVELMGHKVVAGKISKSEMMGKPLLRVDVPIIGNNPAFTQMYGEAAIYCITFVDEKTAIQTATACQTKPIVVYQSLVRQLPDDEATQGMGISAARQLMHNIDRDCEEDDDE